MFIMMDQSQSIIVFSYSYYLLSKSAIDLSFQGDNLFSAGLTQKELKINVVSDKTLIRKMCCMVIYRM